MIRFYCQRCTQSFNCTYQLRKKGKVFYWGVYKSKCRILRRSTRQRALSFVEMQFYEMEGYRGGICSSGIGIQSQKWAENFFDRIC